MVQTHGLWAKTKTGSKAGFDKLYGLVDRLGPPVNKLSNKLGAEAFWPTTLDKESDKAARILRSFCKDGFYTDEERPRADGPQTKQRVLKKIPVEVIRNAKGLAIFTTMRTGLWFSGAGGSGVLVGRREDGTWSPPSGIMLHTAGLGFLVGVDIYDCVVVINTQKALDAFSAIRCTLGGEISAVAGPVGMGGVLESEVHKRQAPVFNYLKSRGFYAGVQMDGTIIIERTDENERFYGERIGVKDILAGTVRHAPYETRMLMETLKAAQGDGDVNLSLLPKEPPPSDHEIVNERHLFGVPDTEDPDPFGVLALEKAGLEIREAGTRRRPASEQFEFKPSPTSPVYTTFRHSLDRSSVGTWSRRSSWRASAGSSTTDLKTSTPVDMETQTDAEPPSPVQDHAPALPPRPTHNYSPTMTDIPEHQTTDSVQAVNEKATETTDDVRRNATSEPTQESTPEDNAPNSQKEGHDLAEDGDDSDDTDDDEEPVIEEILQASAPHMVTRARIITVAKPTPPKLPARSPLRTRRSANSSISQPGAHGMDEATGPLPGSPGTGPPSLRRGGSSSSSQSSISSIEGYDHTSGKVRDDPGSDLEREHFDSVPLSPTKAMPGEFR
ncbi:DUF500-domain-containing protein [Sporormia fimetaria CBS 119925]|uniref:DUF500-domain-containing protein n=1 Tax=Sporormia fimetaria CBS 119925 TaxID=1340428 RepID=A0A6A6VLH6_9PLEO|nr:DUF500-domain-containing protein [Sporormia fimetaria CBS 119925]